MSETGGVDAYIAEFPDDVADLLRNVRAALHRGVPGGGEAIRYKMPTVTLDGRSIVHFAGWKKHLALYPKPMGDKDFERDIAPFVTETATVRFNLGEPIPYDLIERIAAELVAAQQADA